MQDSFSYDANGNLVSGGTNSYTYDAENRLIAMSNGTVLGYDPLGRLWQVTKGTGNTRFLYDGDALVAEYDGGGVMTARYVHGSDLAADDPLLWYDGGGAHWLHANHQGSIVAVTDSSGGSAAINAYDEYGIPGAANSGRFQYTGRAWLSEIGMYYYKARIYSPTLGRFLQVDPIGYKDQINLYGYVGNDPVNGRDPTGTAACGASLSPQECTAAQRVQVEALRQTRSTLTAVRELKQERSQIAAGKRSELSRGALRTEATIRNKIGDSPNLTDSQLNTVGRHLAFTADVLSSDRYVYEKGSFGDGNAAHTFLGFSNIYLDSGSFKSKFSYGVSVLNHEPNHIMGSNILVAPWHWGREPYGGRSHGLWNADTYSNITEECQNWCGK